MRKLKNVIVAFAAFALMLASFCGGAVPVKAEEQVKIEITYLYVNEAGDNSMYVDVQYVPEGTTWGEFFGSYQKCYERGALEDSNAQNEWEMYIQNVHYSSTESYYSNEIHNFNQYMDCALVTCYGYPATYQHAFIAFEYYVGEENKDSGTGWDLLMPSDYVYGSSEAIDFVKKNVGVHDYIAAYIEKPGATVTYDKLFDVTELPEGRWAGYYVKIVVPEKTDGLHNENGKWYYYEDGEWVAKKHAFVDYDGKKFLVANGVVATKANGLAQDPENSEVWYFLSNGLAQTQYTGLAEYNGAWFYLDNGKLDTKLADYVEYNGGLFFVGAGRIMREVNGLAQSPTNADLWYYLAEGQVQTGYTGLAEYDGEWFYIVNGTLAKNYTGSVAYDGSTFWVVNGQLAR